MNKKICLALVLFFISFFLLDSVEASSTVSITVTTSYNVTGSNYMFAVPTSTGSQSSTSFHIYNETYWFQFATSDTNYGKRFWNLTKNGNTGDINMFVNNDQTNLTERGPVRVMAVWSNSSYTDLAGTQRIEFNTTLRYYFYPRHWMDERVITPVANISAMDASGTPLRNAYATYQLADYGRFLSTLISYPNGTHISGSGAINGSQMNYTVNASRGDLYTYGVGWYNGSYPNTSVTFSEAFVDTAEHDATADRFFYTDVSANRRGGYAITLNNTVGPVMNQSYHWVILHTYGNKGGIGGTLPTDEEALTATSDISELILDRAHPASITTITGSYLGRDNTTDTYNLTYSGNNLDFNFTLGDYNRTYPVFHIKDLYSANDVIMHTWWKNYTAGNTWQIMNVTHYVNMTLGGTTSTSWTKVHNSTHDKTSNQDYVTITFSGYNSVASKTSNYQIFFGGQSCTGTITGTSYEVKLCSLDISSEPDGLRNLTLELQREAGISYIVYEKDITVNFGKSSDAVIQDGNSTYFSYDYNLLMLNYTLLNSSNVYEFWISNDTNPATGDSTPPTYSLNSTNSTTAGTAVEFRLNWTDSVGLSNAITSLWNGSSWVNTSSWCDLSSDSWCNQTLIVNSTPPAIMVEAVCQRYYK